MEMHENKQDLCDYDFINNDSGGCNSELRESQVRWFYRDSNDKQWISFNGSDSLNLEYKFRRKRARKLEVSFDIQKSDTNFGEEIECVNKNPKDDSVNVRGGLYEVNLEDYSCVPIYWPDEGYPTRVRRSTWFREVYKNVLEPFEDESVVERLEKEYNEWNLRSSDRFKASIVFKPALQTSNTASATLVGLHSVASSPVLQMNYVNDKVFPSLESYVKETETMDNDLGSLSTQNLDVSLSSHNISESKNRIPRRTVRFFDCHVDWYSQNEAYLYYESTSLYIRQKLGMQKVGVRLYRGYNHEAVESDRLPDISHLCFVVHGIGHKMGLTSIFKNCHDLRETCEKLKTRHFVQPDDENKRVEFLPVEWRMLLQLDGDTVESITPTHVRALRNTLNSSAMDIMYYSSPLYRAEIGACLQNELNRLYRKFLQFNPDFELRGGKVSIIAHSLGCVLIYDLIAGWNQPINHLLKFSTDSKSKSSVTHRSATSPDSFSDYESTQYASPSVQHVETTSTSCSVPDENLEQIARVNIQLESARTLVTQLEQELNCLLTAPNESDEIIQKSEDALNFDSAQQSPHRMKSVNSNPISSNLNSSYFSGNYLAFSHNLANLFCLGSPLGVYLTLRGIRPGPYQTQDNILPRRLCPRILNIYHPADPVAYRLEPLVLKHYANFQPAIIHRSETFNDLWYDDIDPVPYKDAKRKQFSDSKIKYNSIGEYVKSSEHISQFNVPTDQTLQESTRRNSIASRLYSFFSRAALVGGQSLVNNASEPNLNELKSDDDDANTLCPTASEEKVMDDVDSVVEISTLFEAGEMSFDEQQSQLSNMPIQLPNIHSCHTFSLDDEFEKTNVEHSYTNESSLLESLRLEHRIDFELSASRYENMYISTLFSHSKYWTNPDIVLLIMQQLFREH